MLQSSSARICQNEDSEVMNSHVDGHHQEDQVEFL